MGIVEIILTLCIPIALIVVGRFVGRRIERNHYESIEAREAEYAARPAFSNREVDRQRPVARADLATGSVVVSVDHFKRFVSGFRMIFGARCARTRRSSTARGAKPFFG